MNFASAPNCAFASQSENVGDTELVTPVIAVPTNGGKLSFQNRFNLNAGWSRMVLEISINGGGYVDIIGAGGAFLDGGYTHTLGCCLGNPLTGRMAWSGVSGAIFPSPSSLQRPSPSHQQPAGRTSD